jgi:hypothetical protein
MSRPYLVLLPFLLCACGAGSEGTVGTMSELCEDQFLTCSGSAEGVDEYVAECAQDWEDLATEYDSLGCGSEFEALRECWLAEWSSLSGASEKCEGATGELRFEACDERETALESCPQSGR